MLNYKYELAKKISEITNLDVNELETYIEVPPNSDLGDYSFPCFKLAKELKKAPPMIAAEIKEKMGGEDWIEKIDTIGGYFNVFVV